MIDIRNVDIKTRVVTYFCAECEAKYKIKCEMRWKAHTYKSETFDRWLEKHDKCGEAELDARLAPLKAAWVKDLAIVRQIYDENPGIRFERFKSLYLQRVKDIQEMGVTDHA